MPKISIIFYRREKTERGKVKTLYIKTVCKSILILWLVGGMGVRESAAPRFLQGLLDIGWQRVRLTPKNKIEAIPEPLQIQEWQTPF